MVTALKIERTKKNMKQFRLAQLVGVSQAELSCYETGKRRCPADMRRRIAGILDIPDKVLFPEEEEV